MRYAVAVMNYSDNDLRIEIIDASGWRLALAQHSLVSDWDITSLPMDIDEAKTAAFDMDCMFDVKEIPIT